MCVGGGGGGEGGRMHAHVYVLLCEHLCVRKWGEGGEGVGNLT